MADNNCILNMMVSISILTYNRSETLQGLLKSLSSLSYSHLEIIVVDNNSTDNTKKIVKEIYPKVNYTRTNKNIGVSARNIGLKKAKGKIIITLDDDVIGLNDSDLNYIYQLFLNRPKLAAVNFKVLDSKTQRICNWVHHYDVDVYSDIEFDTYEITEGAVAFRKDYVEKVGYYSEKFFIAHEGPDLALRLLNAGYSVIYSPRVKVVHCHANSGRKPWYSYYYNTRNQIYLAARNFPIAYSIKFLGRGLIAMLVYSIRDGFIFYWFKAVIDGVKSLPELLKERSRINHEVMEFINYVEKKRPNIVYYIRNRLLRKKVRL